MGDARRQRLHDPHARGGRVRQVRPRSGRPKPLCPERASRDAGLVLTEILALGRANPDDASEPFNMAYLAMRGCGARQRRQRAARRGQPATSSRLSSRAGPSTRCRSTHVTNGVHVPSWDSRAADDSLDPRVRQGPLARRHRTLEPIVAASRDEELWALRAAQRRDLVARVRNRLQGQLAQRGCR